MGNDKIKILIVDDFEMVRVMLKNALNDLGFKNIEEADGGRAAMVKLKEAHTQGKPFSIIFCDWTMPDVNGIEVLEACRKSNDFKSLPFIMVTAESEQESVVRAIRAGASEYLIKPISAELLELKVNKILTKLAAA